MELTNQILLGFGLAVTVMTITWFICIAIGNASWVDVVWAFSIGIISVFFSLLNPLSNTSIIPIILILIWSGRLGIHLAIRIARESEDGRYLAIKKKWGGLKTPKFFGFFMIQAVAAFLFSLPVLLAVRNSDGLWSVNEWVAIVVATISIIGEGTADRQLKAFKNNPINKGQVCKKGLWRYSRHPNYFFEWIFWLAFPVITISSSAVWFTLAAPFIMLFLILKLTGIPPTEAQAIRKRGDLYRQYQHETSAFVPWFPKQLSTPKKTS